MNDQEISPAAERSARAGGLAYGYPVHRVLDDQVTEHDNLHDVHITRWTAVCGATGTQVGRRYGLDEQPRGGALRALRGELCRSCWPTLSRGR